MTHPIQKVLGIAALVFLLCSVGIAYANPFYAGSSARSAVATTTVTYLTPGTATSTLVYDSYEVSGTNETNQGNTTIPAFATVLVQGNASSTSTVLGVTCEFSADNVDWYQNDIAVATTTNPVPIAQPVSYTFTYASSTLNGLGITPKYAKAFSCPIPLRYVRAVITDTGAGASVWSSILPVKERN